MGLSRKLIVIDSIEDVPYELSAEFRVATGSEFF